jgi:hypothetical protein
MWGALIGAGVNLASGLVGHSQQQKELARQKAEAAKIAAKAEDDAKKARSGLSEYTVGRGFREAAMMAQQDKAGDIAQRQIEEQTAGSIGALKSGGAKALMGGGGVGALLGRSTTRSAQEAAASQARKMAGKTAYATQEQAADDANVSGQRELGLYDLGRNQSISDTERGLGRSLTQDEQLNDMALTQDLLSAGSGAVSGLAGMFGKKGMKVKETPGEFSHKTNPIDLVRNGTKIGEATGGELIFNPEQSGKLETLATEGSTDLHKYLRGLFKKFNKKS